MTEIPAPTRKQFGEFIPNYEMIRRFELLFRIVGEDLFELIAQTSEAGQATANDALARIESVAQEYRTNLTILNAGLANLKDFEQEYKTIAAILEAKTNFASDLSEINKNDLLELEFLTQTK